MILRELFSLLRQIRVLKNSLTHKHTNISAMLDSCSPSLSTGLTASVVTRKVAAAWVRR
jgi:hypothetical protein